MPISANGPIPCQLHVEFVEFHRLKLNVVNLLLKNEHLQLRKITKINIKHLNLWINDLISILLHMWIYPIWYSLWKFNRRAWHNCSSSSMTCVWMGEIGKFSLLGSFCSLRTDMLQDNKGTKQKWTILYASASQPKPIVLSLWYDRYFIAWTTLNPKWLSAIGSRPNNAKATDT